MRARLLIASALLSTAAAAQAGTLTLGAGEDFVHFNRTPSGVGPGITLDYLKRDGGDSAGGAGLDFALPAGPVTLAVGAKGLAIDSDAGSASAGLVGARVHVELPAGFALFGQAYHAPESAASGSVKSVNDHTAGVRWQPLPLVSLEAGYRYFRIKREDAARSRTLADGAYLGAGLAF
ncbi:YfaZ precursor [Crenobacter luteus]|uniref:Porin n=1 Tax=Crenobacter luteus TaxID=1452487 RepID=A0A161RB35_9NEIS|nr:YfaZ family outer membrane protein [Crenobacter luteus]KZE34288.1 hypothetical protein AVW16_06330 [Crenobacter luteus]TCP15159.1 YfaZ precursor [Crenobacter luteus]